MRARVPAPRRLYLAVALLVSLTAVTASGFWALLDDDASPVVPASFIQLVFVALLVRGHPLARQWVRFLGLLAALLAVEYGAGVEVLRFMIFAALSVALFWSVAGLEARRFFDLYCVYCGSSSVRARGLFHTGVVCRDCGEAWKVHEPRVDATVFD